MGNWRDFPDTFDVGEEPSDAAAGIIDPADLKRLLAALRALALVPEVFSCFFFGRL